MLRSRFIALSVFAFAGLAASSTDHGEWTMSPSASPGRIQFSIITSGEQGQRSSSSNWGAGDFRGLDFSTPGKHDVHFTITRDAGSIECEGFLKAGEGAGLFTFKPNPQYRAQMSALGLNGFSPDEQFAFALHDVSLAFARQMKQAGIGDLDSDKLIAFRIHGVSEEFVRDLNRLAYSHLDADKLIAFRIHDVSPEFIQALQKLGYSRVDPDQLIAFRIHGVSPEFVQQLERLGYARPETNELIALRIHEVTPDYIQQLRSRGVQNLTLQQLVALRIHGINCGGLCPAFGMISVMLFAVSAALRFLLP
jgi:hypothetical protein